MPSNFKRSIKQNQLSIVTYRESLTEDFKKLNDAIDNVDLDILVSSFHSADPDMDKKVPFDRLHSLVSEANLTSVPAHELRNFLRQMDSKINFITPETFYKIFEEVKRHEAETDPGFNRNLAKASSIKVVKKRNEKDDKIDAFYDRDEIRAFAKWINTKLKGNKLSEHLLMLDPEDPDNFFKSMTDGIILCLMVQLCSESLIDNRAINAKPAGKEISVFKRIENLNLAINTAKAIGCNTVNQDPTFIMDENPTMCLGLVWQIVRMGLLIKISLNDNPYLMNLALEGETKEDLLKLSQEELLLRWVNYQLDRNENYQGEPVKNFSKDIKDSVAYQYLMEEIQPKNMGLVANPMDKSDLLDRAEDTLQMADRLDCRQFVEPKDIVKGHPKLNLAFVANLFNNHPNLEPCEDSDEIVETREEKTYRNWMNSLGIKPQINYLYTDLRHGVPLLKLEDRIQPGIINWKKVNMPPYKAFGGAIKRTENCTYAVDTAPKLDVKVIGCRGHDIAEGSRTLTLGLVWQLMRAYTVSLLAELSEDKSKKIEDKDVVAWYNEKTGSNVKNFRDKSMNDSVGFYKILKAIKPDQEIEEISPVDSYEDRIDNARYIISVARKMGAVVYTLPEDVAESEAKMTLCLVVTLMVLEKRIQSESEE